LEASRASDIPTPVSFASPPVNEVYLGVQFPGPVADEATTLADFWPRVREDYPTLERQAPIAPAVEDFSVPPAPPTVPFQVEVSHQPFPQRYWFVSLDGNELIQVQPDRFMLNWRQVQESDEYPRYQTLRPEFERRYETFLEALPEESRTAAVPEWCEVTYINHIWSEATRSSSARSSSSSLISSSFAAIVIGIRRRRQSSFNMRTGLTVEST